MARTVIRILCYLLIAAVLFWFVMNVVGLAKSFF